MIEKLAEIFAETGGTIGLLFFGFFAFSFLVVLVIAYLCLKILASIHDEKEVQYRLGARPDRRKSPYRHTYRYGVITRIVRWIRKADD